MVRIAENAELARIIQVARDLGYRVATEPSRIRGHASKPDILIEHGNKSLFVEVKSRPVMLYDILEASEYRKEGYAGTLICVDDASFARIPDSVRSYADQLEVQLCKTTEAGKVLKSTLD